MKWLLYALSAIGGLLVLAVIILLVMGGGRGESTLEAGIDIAKPPQTVFPYLTEPQKIKSWVSWLVDIRTLTPGQRGVGSRDVWVMEDRNNNNQRMDIETTVTGYEQDKLLAAKLSAAMGFTGDVTYALQPIDGNRTRLNYKASYKFEHWLAKLLEPVISRSAHQKLREDLARLKRHAEAE